MDNCKSCGEKYDYTEQEHLVSFGVLANITKCPNCGHPHRTDYISSTIVILSFILIIYASYLLIKLGSGELHKHTTELSLFALGAIGVFVGFKSTRLVSTNET